MFKTFTLIQVVLALIASAAFSAGSLTPKPAEKTTQAYGASQASRLTAATLLMQKKQYAKAYENLSQLSSNASDEADRQNLLGFSARKIGNYSAAQNHYELALQMDPDHLGALEYQGKLFLILGQIGNSQRNLEKLKKRCFLVCPSEYKKLLQAIEESK